MGTCSRPFSLMQKEVSFISSNRFMLGRPKSGTLHFLTWEILFFTSALNIISESLMDAITSIKDGLLLPDLIVDPPSPGLLVLSPDGDLSTPGGGSLSKLSISTNLTNYGSSTEFYKPKRSILQSS
jgi:hypothetical protein